MCGQIHTNAVHESHTYKPQAGHNITIKGAKCMMTKKLFLSSMKAKESCCQLGLFPAKLILSFSETSLFSTLTVFHMILHVFVSQSFLQNEIKDSLTFEVLHNLGKI